jgi:tyrosyl-tRNA synthetase
MNQPVSKLLSTLKERGFIYQLTDESGLQKAFSASEISCAYIGFDCTAPSLHVGSLLQIMMLRILQQHGVKPLVLLGGATTRIGDPSGKDETRRVLDDAEIAKNMAGIRKVFEKFLRFDGPNAAEIVNNADWLDNLGYIDLLRNVGRHFSVNRMLSMTSAKQRLEREAEFNFVEFNYMLFQAYDFVELQRRYNCRLQIGGSDQWGNIVSGVELSRKMLAAEGKKPQEIFGVTTPLLTTANGVKMGKTVNGAVWLSPELLSAYDYWQFWRNVDDADVEKFLLFFTEIPSAQIKSELETARGSSAINEWKKKLATAATILLHGEAAAENAAATARQTFESGGAGEGLPHFIVSDSELSAGISLLKALVCLGFAASLGEARRLIRGNAVRVNDEAISDEQFSLLPFHVKNSGGIKISSGKKRHGLVVSE